MVYTCKAKDKILMFPLILPTLIFSAFSILSAMWWKKPEYPERITDHGQATDQLYHLRLKSSAPFFVIYKAGREPTPYWF
jgi:predicted outer membrane lipoprotein